VARRTREDTPDAQARRRGDKAQAKGFTGGRTPTIPDAQRRQTSTTTTTTTTTTLSGKRGKEEETIHD
jgi:hypothetical protein